ncbi:MAG: SRPBCC domain-containing protein [Pseudomonadota bacterium]
MIAPDTIVKTVFFNAAPETVWSFLVERDKLAQWFHPPESDLVAGSEYRLVTTADDGAKVPLIWGRVVEMDPPRKLVTTFVITPFKGNETTVTWVLEEAAGGTRLTLTHEGIAAAAGPAALDMILPMDNGWDEHFADLRKAVA